MTARGPADIAIERGDDPYTFHELDELAASIPGSSPFQTGLLAHVYRTAPDAEPIALLARDGRGSVVGGMLAVNFVHGPLPRSLARRLTSHCTVRGTPLAASSEGGARIRSLLFSELESRIREQSMYVRYYPDRETPLTTELQSAGFGREDWLNFLLDLRQPTAVLLAKMSKHRRKGIRFAEKSRVEVSEIASRPEIVSASHMMADTHRRLRVPFQSIGLFCSAYEWLFPRGRVMFLAARYGHRTVAVRVVLLHDGIAYDWYSGATTDAAEVHAEEGLVWAAILEAKERGATCFDFGGAGMPTIEYGPREFKRRFGGTLTNFGRFTKVLQPARLRIALVAGRIVRRIP
jgi:serine/alanine adding enzyme